MATLLPPIQSQLTLQAESIAAETTAIRSLDWNRERFDIEFSLEKGTTYNAFLIEAEHLALVDTAHEKFRSQWLDLLQQQVRLDELKYLIVSHTEPDHSGLIQDVLVRAPQVTVVGTKVALQFLADWVHIPFQQRIVKNGDQIDLGQGHVLEFIMAPNLHWPDTMLTYDHKTGVLFTCDVFGMHYCDLFLYDEHLDAIESHFHFYYNCLMAPNARSVLSGMKRMSQLPPIQLIATGHGPLLKYYHQDLTQRYFTWSQEQTQNSTVVAVFYVADYGCSELLTQAVGRGVTKVGALIEWVDLSTTDLQEIRDLVSVAAGIVISTPPSSHDLAQTAVQTILAAANPKQVIGLVTSCGLEDEPIDPLMNRFRDLGLTSGFEPIRIQGEPTLNTYQVCEESGTDLAQMLLKSHQIQQMKGWNSDLDRALGRLAGGLYIVTARKAEQRSAMLASWVAQASLDPPGLTIAVAKDRAIESFLHTGDSFVLNVLQEGQQLKLMRHFLKWFPPGADRFAGLQTQEGSNGGIILAEALAYLECEVKSRTEVGDHWLIYAEVRAGRVSHPEGMTATHYRKAGNHY
jgi:flavorubredoxin/flavin reductase (DIM6/NTAB) family NADH-FMN oxidoreductase RutF